MSSKRNTYIRDEEMIFQPRRIPTRAERNRLESEARAWAIVGACLVLVGALVFASIASAQEPRTAVITFARPTKYTDGTDLLGTTVVTYGVYQGAKGNANKPRVATITGTETTIDSGLPVGETCWQITSIANGLESAKSNEACKTFTQPAPQSVTITVR